MRDHQIAALGALFEVLEIADQHLLRRQPFEQRRLRGGDRGA
jgi:hypothetical protein